MATTSGQTVMPTTNKDLQHTTPHSITSAAKLTDNETNSLSTTSIRTSTPSTKERRPPFSITLPPSCSRSSHLTSHSLVFNTIAGPGDDNDSTAGFEEALALQQEGNESNNHGAVGLQPMDDGLPVRRRSVQFIPGEDDSLTNHEGKEHGLPKTPYPVTDEQDLQRTLFSKH
ncbi:hypothetical protein EC957_010619 [Mortierella hygrophila]|uniref:Uncharacterized protein n=1 Tax=Mortierella hygrophila TaxID=979708 RepID=A0A9P6FAK8_9FUNG|nr:hypothetical protein EC957_010619 [Mortierella hygrophila]